MRYSVDPRCRELADHFLEADASETERRQLAQEIQDCVEDHLDFVSQTNEILRATRDDGLGQASP